MIQNNIPCPVVKWFRTNYLILVIEIKLMMMERVKSGHSWWSRVFTVDERSVYLCSRLVNRNVICFSFFTKTKSSDTLKEIKWTLLAQ